MDYEIKIEVDGHNAFTAISTSILTLNPALASLALEAVKKIIPYLENAAKTYERESKAK